MLVFPQLKYISGRQQPEAVVVPGHGCDAAVSLDAGGLHPPVVQAALVARRNVILIIWKKMIRAFTGLV